MPFVATITQYPAAGKAAESRGILEERVKALQGMGIEANLTADAWGPDYPSYRINQRFATLADFESTRDKRAAPEFAPRLAALSRRTLMNTLNETLMRSNQSGPQTKWTQFVLNAPAVGKVAEIRAVLMERAKQNEAAGRRVALNVQVAGAESGVFTMTLSYASLAELEERRAGLPGDASYRAFVEKLNPLISRPTGIIIRETLIPYPQR